MSSQQKNVRFYKELNGPSQRVREFFASIGRKISTIGPQRRRHEVPEFPHLSKKDKRTLDYVTSVPHPSVKGARCITGQGLKELLHSPPTSVEEVVLLDCRYPYEFQGGHIRGALNVYSSGSVARFMQSHEDRLSRRHVIVVYCDFSVKRAPRIADKLLSHFSPATWEDRPHVFLLLGGYVNFLPEEDLKSLCEPPAYVSCLWPSLSVNLDELRCELNMEVFHHSILDRVQEKLDRRLERARDRQEEVRGQPLSTALRLDDLMKIHLHDHSSE